MFEIVRRLDEVTRRLDHLTTTLEDRYVPRREYEQRISEVEKDLNGQSAFRRQVAAGLIVGLLLMVAQIIVVLTRLPGGGS
jgi:hypothetical protein